MSAVMNTCLSPGVYQLVCEGRTAGGSEEEAVFTRDFLTHEHLLDWELIGTLIPEIGQTTPGFGHLVWILSPGFRAVQSYMTELSVDDFFTQYSQYMTWTSNPEMCLRCFSILKEGRVSSGLLSLLISTAVLERSLGTLYLIKGKQCPSLLKDLLVTAELESILGSSVINFLRVLIGPPTSLNLRNLVWHGFPAPGEIPTHYCYVLLMIIVSLGKVVQTTVDVRSMPRRAPVNFNLAEKIQQRFTETDSVIAMEMLRDKVKHTEFVLPQFVLVWEDALDVYLVGKYGESVALLFPLVENGLRVMFAQINDCPHRILTAESSVLYTTFDEMLARQLPDDKENKLLERLPKPVLALLQDLMVYPEGPRFRDRLGHGEANFQDITQQQASAVWLAAMALICAFISPSCSLDSQTDQLEVFNKRMQSYTSIFHPVSLLVDQMLTVNNSLALWSTTVHYTHELEKMLDPPEEWFKSWGDNSHYTELLPLIKPVEETLSKHLDCMTEGRALMQHENFMSVLEVVSSSAKITTLSNSLSLTAGLSVISMNSASCEDGLQCTMEIVNLLRKTMSECLEVSDNVLQSLSLRQQQLEDKQLRSRQRDTLKRLLNSLPCLSVGMRIVLLMASAQLISPNCHLQMKFNIRFLKAMLKYCENIRTYSAIDKNKWLECVDLTKTFFGKVAAQ